MLRIGDPGGWLSDRDRNGVFRGRMPLRRYGNSPIRICTFRMHGRYQELRYFLLRVDGHHLSFRPEGEILLWICDQTRSLSLRATSLFTLSRQYLLKTIEFYPIATAT